MTFIDWKSIISGIIGAIILSAIWWLLGLIGKAPTVLVPPGAIIAFSGKCPTDGTWQEYSKATNKFFRGSPDQDSIGTFGGADGYIMTTNNLPKHHHGVHGTNHTSTPANADTSHNEYGLYIENYTFTEYEGKENPDPIPTVPKYVYVQFCEKK